jgi:hypothetical protein
MLNLSSTNTKSPINRLKIPVFGIDLGPKSPFAIPSLEILKFISRPLLA